MKKIMYIPLDERPCNYLFPKMISEIGEDIELVIPEIDLLSKKKKNADVAELWKWIFENLERCDYGILSIEMLVYGGLLPSRLHMEDVKTLKGRLEKLKRLKEIKPEFKIYLSNLIMRTPKYNSADEEPDYYENWGRYIFKWGYLREKMERDRLTIEEAEELKIIEKELPEEHLSDYKRRRAKNIEINKEVISYVEDDIIEFLAIPQDDSATYGFTAIDQKIIVNEICSKRLQEKIHMYPGADEVGCTLLGRLYLDLENKKKRIFPLYSSVNSKGIIPLYEDRPFLESFKAHVEAANCILVDTPQEADFILAINTAGKVMQEAWDNPIKDLTYSTFRNLREFVTKIKYYLEKGKKVAVADVAFANGGESELVQLMDDKGVWDNLLGYAGWNTSCNTLGTVIATGIIASDSGNKNKIDYNKIYRILEDWAYQTTVRMEMNKNFIGKYGADYLNLNGKNEPINQEMEKRVKAEYKKLMRNSFKKYDFKELALYSPWDRMFEIGIILELKSKGRGE